VRNKTIFGEFLKYSSANILSMIGLSCYIFADTYFISGQMGANGLASLNLAIPIFSFIFAGAFLFGIGGATKYAILRGQGKDDNANRVFTTTVTLASLFSIVFFVLGIFFTGRLARLFGADDAIFKMTKDYLQVVMLTAPLLVLKNVLTSFIRNDGAPGTAMAAMLSSSLSNIGLSYLFVVVLKMGMFGAALATGVGAALGCSVIVWFFVKKKNNFKLIKCRVTRDVSFGIISTGTPGFVAEISAGAVIITFNSIILGLNGNVGLAAYGIIINIWIVVAAIFNGIAGGVQPLIARYHGQGKQGGTKTVLRYALVVMVVLSGLFYATVFFGATQLAGIFNSENNPLLQSMAIMGLRIYFIAAIFFGFNVIISTYLTSTEKPRPAQVISILRGFLLLIPMAFLLSSTMGMNGVWLAFPVTELVVCLLAAGFFILTLKGNADK